MILELFTGFLLGVGASIIFWVYSCNKSHEDFEDRLKRYRKMI